jgi:type II secretory pathway pseudopilin PulG
MRGARQRQGVVLLEALIAMALIGVVGAAVAALAIQAGDAIHRANRNDRELRRASNFLESVSLWTREDLDRHLGSRLQGSWRLDVEHPFATCYSVTLSDSNGTSTLLRTTLYRPVATAARP